MFAVFLPALNFRGNRSPYLWWFYKLLSELGDQAGYVCGDEYFREPAQLSSEGRTEASDGVAASYQYRLPDRAVLDNAIRADIPLHVWLTLEGRYPANPLAAFEHYCLEEDGELYLAIARALDELAPATGTLEAVITCVNCATLRKLCRDRNLPLVHVELGPLRRPAFLHTAYFDFSGVNGATEARGRFEAVVDAPDDSSGRHALEMLRGLLMIQRQPERGQPDVDLGLCLQIEDDSNILCYANGYTSLSLINHARNQLAERGIVPPVLVRAHPGSFFSLRRLPSGLKPDVSPTSVDFAMRCKRVHTINSGLAVEALLLGRQVTVYGDCPFLYCVSKETGYCDAAAFSFFLLNYLVPWQLALTPEYIRWRLGNPPEQEIRRRHLERFMQEKIEVLERQVAELEQQLADIKSSLAWRVTFPLRALARVAHRLFGRRVP